ncbi:YdcF family protein [Enterococcus sp. BWR-S5]|uniref:YdcF family protein n=1 Tax=Enterococcus sp. BWR-S5 TaxID=2787714 RepID=UPI0019214EAD|nr:YdcF family protein [Enterococcus sp. BWR-S5]MBL1226158.1 YdcF family protein [Enterococcus sp. BWR-S5]
MKFYFEMSLFIFFVLGLVLIPIWNKTRKEKGNWLLYELGWFGICFLIYILQLEVKAGSYLIGIPLAFLGIFFFLYKKEKRKLSNGLLFNIFLVSFGGYLGLLAIQTQDSLLILFLVSVLFGLLLLALVGLYALIIFLYWNALIVWRKEGHSLANLLTLFLAVGLTALLILNYVSGHFLPSWMASLFSIIPILLGYFAIVFYNFLTISILYQFNRPRYNQDYIIVLGAGLIDGKRVPPLLGNRIEKAIQFYNKQKKKNKKALKLVMSGGKGDDEHLAEGLAMKQFAMEKGIPEEDILVEANSVNTLENMRFSKEIMNTDFGSDKYHAIFTTNNFHLFRAGLFARQAGLKADGIGAKTAFYFLPNAFLREFAAIVLMRKKRHMLICGTIVVLILLVSLLQLLTTFLSAG